MDVFPPPGSNRGAVYYSRNNCDLSDVSSSLSVSLQCPQEEEPFLNSFKSRLMNHLIYSKHGYNFVSLPLRIMHVCVFWVCVHVHVEV